MSADNRHPIAVGAALAVVSAVSFGLTTPIISRFGQGAGPLTTAALLYIGAAASSVIVSLFVEASGRSLQRAALPRVLLVALFGAALAPTLLAWGLSRAGATSSSLVLNLEAVFTVLFARLMYAEHVGRRVALAVVAMLIGGLLAALDVARHFEGAPIGGLLAVVGATACWAMDNTLTRSLADENPLDVVIAKGSFGALATGALAFLLGEPGPRLSAALPLLLCGATGYGVSLHFYLLAQRRIGAVRTGSIFATGPFVGAGLAWLLGDRQAGAATGVAACAFGLGVYLHLTERHSHAHQHPALEHEHPHRHDDGHHDHVHDPPVVGEHTHSHRHALTEHEHEHAPDLHHRHPHS